MLGEGVAGAVVQEEVVVVGVVGEVGHLRLRWEVQRPCIRRWICPTMRTINLRGFGRYVNSSCLCIPHKPRGMMFHHVLPHVIEDGRKCPNPFDMRLISTKEV